MSQPAVSPSPSPILPFTGVQYPSASPNPSSTSQEPSASESLSSSSYSSSSSSSFQPNSSPSISSSPLNDSNLVHVGVDLLLNNRFDDASQLFHRYCDRENKIGLLNCYMSFVKASASHGETDLKDALTLIWSLEKRVEKHKLAPIEGKLIQADCHFLGSIIQIISQKYIKAALNLRKAVNFYAAAQKDLQTYNGPDRAELVGWCEYGNGFFNLLLSFLPPSIMKVANWVGYGGDRDVGLALLHRSQQSTSFMAPFSCLLLLTYYASIPALTGEPENTYVPISDQLFQWAEARYPESTLFLLQKSRSWRCKRNLKQAIVVAKKAIQNCRELPSVAILGHFNTGWCSFFMLDWQQSAFYFDELIHLEPSGAYVPPVGQPKHSPEELALIEEEKSVAKRMPPAKTSTSTFYAYMAGLNYMLLGNPHKARWYFQQVDQLFEKKSDKPLDLYAKRKATEMLARNFGDRKEDAILDAAELILMWNGASQMSDSSLRTMIDLLTSAESLRLPHWKVEQYAAVYLFRADLYKGLADLPAAVKEIQIFLSLVPQFEKSAKAKSDGIIPIGYYTSAFLLVISNQLQLAQEHLKKAKTFKGYDQENQIAIRCHALEQRIQRTKVQQVETNTKK